MKTIRVRKKTKTTDGAKPAEQKGGSKISAPAGSADSPASKPTAESKSDEVKRGDRPGDVYLRKGQPLSRLFRRVGPGRFIATQESDRPGSVIEKGYRAVKRVLIGRPLETAEEINQRLTKLKALAVFGSDAISSSAYATEASLVILMAAGSGALNIDRKSVV
jgi:hypothetical protein